MAIRSLSKTIILALLMLALIVGAIGCPKRGPLSKDEFPETVCTQNWENFLATFCPLLDAKSDDAREICEHSAAAAHEIKLAACIGADVIEEPTD